MRYPIDVLLLDDGWRVLRVVTMRPGRLLLPRRRVRHVLELPTPCGVRRRQRIQILTRSGSLRWDQKCHDIQTAEPGAGPLTFQAASARWTTHVEPPPHRPPQ